MPRKKATGKKNKPPAKNTVAKIISTPSSDPAVEVAPKEIRTPSIAVGCPDAKGVFDALFEAQWGLPRDKREAIMGRLLGMAIEGSDSKCLEATDRLLEAQKLDVKVFESMVKGMATALGNRNQVQEIPALTDKQLDERLALIAERTEDEPVPVPIRRGRPQLLSDDDEYEVAN